MKTLKIDGYAIRNTKHVLRALKTYRIKVAKMTRTKAVRAAVDRYAALSGRRVSGRTVRRWIATIKRYGHVEKVPPNTFGALKSCPHVSHPVLRPIRDRLSQIEAVAAQLEKECRRGKLPQRAAMELTLIARDFDSVSSCVYAPARPRLAAIRRRARRVGSLPIQRLYQFAESPEIESSLVDILTRLKAMASKRT